MTKPFGFWQTAKVLFPFFIVLGVGVAQFHHWLGLGSRKAAEVPHYVLTDQTGRLVTEQSFLGKYSLIYFGYTFCPDVCPTSLATISGALDQMGEASGKVVPILITVDPNRDTPAVLADYVHQFRADMVGLSGTAVQTSEAAGQFGSSLRPPRRGRELHHGSLSRHLSGRTGRPLPDNDCPCYAAGEAQAGSGKVCEVGVGLAPPLVF